MKCQYTNCKRYSWENDREGYCIFHSMQIGEKTEAFQKAWTMFLDKRARDDGSYRHIHCSGFVFPETLSLSKFTFTEGANFQGARFSGDAHFEGVRFQGHAYFGASSFLGSAYLEGARFEKITSFDSAQFHGVAFFEEVRFGGTAEFQRSHFRGGSHFGGTRFDGDAHFRETIFTEGIEFVGARISKKVDFRNAKGGPIRFEKVVLDGADLRGCSLSNLHLTQITKHRGARFGPTEVQNVNWTGSHLLREKALDQNYLFDFRTRNRLNRYFLYPLWRVTSNLGGLIAILAKKRVRRPI